MRDNCISLKYPPFDWKSQICNRDIQRKILKSNGNSKGVKKIQKNFIEFQMDITKIGEKKFSAIMDIVVWQKVKNTCCNMFTFFQKI